MLYDTSVQEAPPAGARSICVGRVGPMGAGGRGGAQDAESATLGDGQGLRCVHSGKTGSWNSRSRRGDKGTLNSLDSGRGIKMAGITVRTKWVCNLVFWLALTRVEMMRSYRKGEVLWSPNSLVLALCILPFAAIGLIPLDLDIAAEFGLADSVTRWIYVTGGLACAYLSYRALVRRVIVGDHTVIVKQWLGRAKHLRIVDADIAQSDGPAGMVWSVSVPVVKTVTGDEIELNELAGYEFFGRGNRRVRRAVDTLKAATE